jgi:glycosyltransferase involved in cell wall biosynthesis
MKLLLFANTDWYLYNFRRSLALAAREAGYEVLLVSPPGPYGRKLLDLGLRWIEAPMRRRSLNPLEEFALLLWLTRLARAEKASVVHGFTIKCAVYGALAARLSGAASVNAVAGMGYVFISDEGTARLLRPIVRALMRVAFGGARARIILQNPDDVAVFEKASLAPAAQIRLIPGSGVDCARFLPSAEVERHRSAPLRVVLAARMLWDKGVREFVEAAKLLKDENRGLCFVLAGASDPGNPAAIGEETLLGWQAAGLVEWLGHVDDMPALLASADVVVLPSYREGLPKSLIEAAACARPLITTDAPGCREVVKDGIDGLLVPIRDASALARAIARLQDDPALARKLGDAARAKALAEYDERRIVARTLDVYGEFAGARTRQSQRTGASSDL